MPHQDVPVIYIVSDSVGDSAATIAVAAASQFTSGTCTIHRMPMATHIEQITEFIDAHLPELSNEEIVLFYTIADEKLRAQLEDYLEDKPVAAVDLIGPAIDAIAEATGRKPKGEPGLLRKTSKQYYNRIGAMGFAVEHDDGRNIEQLGEADIVLIGVSRTSKTPLSIYLATYGFKVANVPLTTGIAPPPELYELDHRRIFGLTSEAKVLSRIRLNRLGNAAEVAASYADPMAVQEDIDEARQVMRSLGCIVVHTDGRSIEETAHELLRYYELTFPHAKDANIYKAF
jgi:regulator of PEP synthase PpsR (kinase-PPPase family)